MTRYTCFTTSGIYAHALLPRSVADRIDRAHASVLELFIPGGRWNRRSRVARVVESASFVATVTTDQGRAHAVGAEKSIGKPMSAASFLCR